MTCKFLNFNTSRVKARAIRLVLFTNRRRSDGLREKALIYLSNSKVYTYVNMDASEDQWIKKIYFSLATPTNILRYPRSLFLHIVDIGNYIS